MITALSLTVASSTNVSQRYPAPPPRTMITVNQKTYDFKCRVFDADFKPYKVVLSQTGGRGYVAKSGGLASTPFLLKVIADETGFITNFSGGSPIITEWRNESRAEILNNFLPRQSAILYFHTAPKGKFNMQIYMDIGPKEGEILTGFCDVAAREQVPLSENETKEFLATKHF